MADIESLQAYGGQLAEAAELASASAKKQHEYVNGGPVDDVLTESGLVPTIAKQAVMGQAKVTASLAEVALQMAGAMTYANTALGLAGTNNGGYFSVPSSEADKYLVLYQNVSHVAVVVDEYPNAESVQEVRSRVPRMAPIGFAWSAFDKFFRAAIGVKDDGTFAARLAEIFEVRTKALKVLSHSFSVKPYPGFKWVLEALGKAAVGVKDDGTFAAKVAEVSSLKVNSINGLPYVPSMLARYGGNFPFQKVFINNFGQSLAEGSTPATALTTVQEYNNIGFPARSTDPAAFVPLTVANTQVGTRGESPMYGTLGHIKELIAKENGISYLSNDYQLLGCNNGYSGFSITKLEKGTDPYAAVISQVRAAHNLALAEGKSFTFQCSTWTQGEADAAMTKDEYKGHLKQLAVDLNADAKAIIPGQFRDHLLITYQCASADRKIAIAQLEASNESGLIVMACPMYQFDYGDSQHINAVSSKWLGAYYAIANKRTFVDNKEWKPLQPVGHVINGNTVDLIFNRSGLVLDTSLIPAQVDMGFQVRDASNVITINSVSVLSPNRVRLVLSGNPAPGWVVRYGYNNAVGKGAFVGGCGNLRDSQGDTLVYSAINKPMHNWCVIFNYSL